MDLEEFARVGSVDSNEAGGGRDEGLSTMPTCVHATPSSGSVLASLTSYYAEMAVMRRENDAYCGRPLILAGFSGER